MSVWVTYFYDVSAIIGGIFSTEMEARRSAGEQPGFLHVVEVPLPCADVVDLINAPRL